MKDESYGLSSKNSWKEEWGTSPYLSDDLLLVYRCVSGLFWLGFTLYDFSRGEKFKVGSRHWTFLTTWVTFTTDLYFIAVCVTILMLRFTTSGNELPCIGKFAWILLNIIAGTSMTITLGYWLLLYEGGDVSFRGIVGHGLGSVWILVDIVVTYNPLYFKHIYQCVLYMLVYTIMTIIYDYSLAKSEWYVYSYINWSEDIVEALYMSFAFMFVICPLLYFLQALLKPQLPLIQIEEAGYFCATSNFDLKEDERL